MTRKTDGNTCTECKKFHEECAGEKTCSKWEISLYVCQMFGIRVTVPAVRRKSST
ncbi:hypothetical protein SEA_MADAMATO_51 [Streptomyces phage Madamato]|nr:hypothetical protein SEA_MADAMATO_51 [Streptomyces phage Madamato]